MVTGGVPAKHIPQIGFHYGRTDLERLGFFAEMTYLHGLGYNPPIRMPQIRDPKNRQMLPGYPKWKTTGLQDCYFDKDFKRIFLGEAYYDEFRSYLRGRMEEAKKNKGIFKLSSYTHLQSTPGDYYGCFTTTMRAFDPRQIPPPPKPEGKKDAAKAFVKFIPPSPGKKGSYGYLDTTINPYPKYLSSPFEIRVMTEKKDPKGKKTVSWLPPSPPGLLQKSYMSNRVVYNQKVEGLWWPFGVFKPPNPAKSLGGCMDGCFDKWPNHAIDFYIDPWRIEKGNPPAAKPTKEKDKDRPTAWFPNGTGKSFPTPSVMEKNIRLCTNAKTWKTMTPITYTREFI